MTALPDAGARHMLLTSIVRFIPLQNVYGLPKRSPRRYTRAIHRLACRSLTHGSFKNWAISAPILTEG
jgi:hypothetical protein